MHRVANGQNLECSRREWLLAGLLAALFVSINLAVATHTPTVWADEPGYTDPAANLYFGSGFTSTMWGQDHHEFWTGNVPLCQGILYAAFKIFGFGLFQARAVNTMLACGGAILIWAGLRSSRIVLTSAGRLLCLALMLSGAVSTLTFRTVRPDATMFFVCALVFFCSQLPLPLKYRCLLAGAAGTLLPFAGVPMLPYIGVMSLIGFICLGWAEAGLFASVCLGVGSGIGLLVVFYNWFGSFKAFFHYVLGFTVTGGQAGTGAKMWHTKVFGEYPGADNLLTCFFGNPVSFVDQKTICDYSAVLLFGLFLVLAVSVWRTADMTVRRRIIFVVLLTLTVPPVLHFAAHYRSMYRWMTYIPLTIAVPWILGLKPEVSRRKPIFWTATLALGASLAAGVPARTALIIPSWSERSIAPLEKATAALVRPDDEVVCSLQDWFAIRPHARLVYCCDLPARGVLSQTVDLPTNNISLLCLLPKDYTNVTRIVGGRWQKIQPGEFSGLPALEKTRYAVSFYRRVPQ